MSSCLKLTKPYRNNIKFLETNFKKKRVLGEPLSELHNIFIRISRSWIGSQNDNYSFNLDHLVCTSLCI